MDGVSFVEDERGGVGGGGGGAGRQRGGVGERGLGLPILVSITQAAQFGLVVGLGRRSGLCESLRDLETRDAGPHGDKEESASGAAEFEVRFVYHVFLSFPRPFGRLADDFRI